MGRTRNWPPKIHISRGYARVYWRDRWYHLGPEGSRESEIEYGRLIALWSVDPGATVRRADDLLVAELCARWLEQTGPEMSPRSRYRCGRCVQLLLELHLVTPVCDFDALAMEAWQRWLAAQTDSKGRKTYSRGYILELVSVVRRIWTWGVRFGLTSADQVMILNSVPVVPSSLCRASRVISAANRADVEAALPFMRPPVAALVRLQLLTGARPSELFRLKPGDILRTGKHELPGVGVIDLDREKLWVTAPREHKTARAGKFRWLLFGAEAQRVLKPFLRRGPEEYLFSPRESVADLRNEQRKARKGLGNRKKPAEKPALPAKAHYDRRGYLQAVTRACRRAGVPRWTPYQLRHLVSVEIEAKYGLDDAQALLGHSNPQTTRRYTKRSFDRASRVAKEQG